MAEKLIWVKSCLKPSGNDPQAAGPVALWEKDPAHPDGEVFVAGDKPVQVAMTSAVEEAINTKRLEKVSGPADEQDEPKDAAGAAAPPKAPGK